MKIRKYTNVDRWFIDTEGEPLPDPQGHPDWTTCPGSLHQDYDSYAEAKVAAEWWGYSEEH